MAADPWYDFILDFFKNMWHGVWSGLSGAAQSLGDSVTAALFGYDKDNPDRDMKEGGYASGTLGGPWHEALSTPIHNPDVAPSQPIIDLTNRIKALADAEMTRAKDIGSLQGLAPDKTIRDVMKYIGPLGYILLPLTILGGLFKRNAVAYEHVLDAMRLAENFTHPDKPPDIPQLMALAMRFPGVENACKQLARLHGFDGNAWDLMKETAQATLTEDQAYLAWRRGLFGDLETESAMALAEMDARILQNGWREEDVPIIKSILEPWPSAPDLIRFSVREVYDNAFAEKWQTDADYPQQFENDFCWTGWDKKWAQKYWRAHWELPSVMMGFEMLHRNIIGLDDLKGLMKALDIMPGWRDRLIELSYHPLTRVDVRRMHQLGTLDRDGVLKAYLDVGYSPENAELMTQFTEDYNMGKDRTYTKSSVIKWYEKGYIEEEDVLMYLEEMGYDADQISWLLKDATSKRIEAGIEDMVESVRMYLESGTMSEAEVYEMLRAQGLSLQAVERILTKATAARVTKAPKPTVEHLADFWRAGVFDTADAWGEHMSQIGYIDTYIQGYAAKYGVSGFVTHQEWEPP